MTRDEAQQLFDLVRDQVEKTDRKFVADVIGRCHRGQLTGFANPETLYLFRLYRNTISPDPDRLISDALLLGEAIPKGWDKAETSVED